MLLFMYLTVIVVDDIVYQYNRVKFRAVKYIQLTEQVLHSTISDPGVSNRLSRLSLRGGH
jgi:hypothetical protein